MGSACDQLGLWEEAAQHLSAALELNQRLHAKDTKEACALLTTLARVYLHCNRPVEAVEALMRIWEASEGQCGCNHVTMAPVYLQLARAYLALGDECNLQQNALQVIDILSRHSFQGPKLDNSQVFEACNLMSESLKRQERFGESLQYAQRALEICSSTASAQIKQKLLLHAATTAAQSGQFQIAFNHLSQLASAQQLSFTTGDRPSCRRAFYKTQKRMGDVLLLAQRPQEARRHYEQALYFYQRHYGQAHPTSKVLCGRIEAIKQDNTNAQTKVEHWQA